MRVTTFLGVALAATGMGLVGCDGGEPELSATTTTEASAGQTPDSMRSGRRFTITLDGASEVPGPGDEDGTGTARLTVNHGQRSLCYDVMVENIETPTMAHVHVGADSVAGPVVIPLDVTSGPKPTHFTGCVEDVDRALLRAIMMNPSDYYVNVHNTPFPAGAVRGQLGRGRQNS